MKSGVQLFLDHYKGQFAKGEVTEERLSQMVLDGILEEDEKRYIMEGESENKLKELEDFHKTVMAKVRGE